MTGHKVGADAVLDRLVEVDDLSSDSYFHDPHPYWARMRRDQPLFHDTSWDSWILTRYDDVEAVFKDFEGYSNATYTGNTGAVLGTTLLEMDGMDHVVRRSIVAPRVRRQAARGLPRGDRPQRPRPHRTVAASRPGRPRRRLHHVPADQRDHRHARPPEGRPPPLPRLVLGDDGWTRPGRAPSQPARPPTPRSAPTSSRSWPSVTAARGPTCSPRSPTAKPTVSGCRRPRS